MRKDFHEKKNGRMGLCLCINDRVRTEILTSPKQTVKTKQSRLFEADVIIVGLVSYPSFFCAYLKFKSNKKRLNNN